MGLKAAGATLLLKGGLLNRTLYVASMSDGTTEFADSWYARVAIALAGWTRTNAGLAENAAAVDFPDPTANASLAPRFWGLHSASTGGTLYATQALTGTPDAPRLGASFGFDAGDLELAVGTSSAVTGRGLRRAFESGIVSGTTYMGILSNQPSGASPDELDDRVAVVEAVWTPHNTNAVRNSQALNFGVQATDVDQPMWLGLYDASTGGNLLWEDELDVAAMDPDAGDTISVPINMATIGFTTD